MHCARLSIACEVACLYYSDCTSKSHLCSFVGNFKANFSKASPFINSDQIFRSTWLLSLNFSLTGLKGQHSFYSTNLLVVFDHFHYLYFCYAHSCYLKNHFLVQTSQIFESEIMCCLLKLNWSSILEELDFFVNYVPFTLILKHSLVS